MRQITFAFIDEALTRHYTGFTDGSLWNGWRRVCVTSATLAEMLEDEDYNFQFAMGKWDGDIPGSPIFLTPWKTDFETLFMLDGATATEIRVDYWRELSIQDRQHAENFFRWLAVNGINFHPDTKFDDYVDVGGHRTFPDMEAHDLDKRMNEAFLVLGDEVYEVASRMRWDRLFVPKGSIPKGSTR